MGKEGQASAPSGAPPVAIVEASTPVQVGQARALFREYADQLGVDLCSQGFDAELDGLPGDYAPPAGVLLLAWVDGALAGCGALRPLPEADYPNACEMKRLYVRQGFRRFGLGRLLARHLMDRALEAGYSTMLLDTLDDNDDVQNVYANFEVSDSLMAKLSA